MTQPTPHGPPSVATSGNRDDTTVPTLPGQGEVIWEKPHDIHALYLPLLRGTLKRGFIVQDKNDPATKANKHGRPLGLHFLYNPTEVDVAYEINTSIFPASAAPGSDVPLIGIPGAASVSFNLILDRTYDVQDPNSNGILEDVHQFERMMVYDETQPFIQPVAMFVVFGNTKMKYYGYIQGFQIVYTNWTQDMRPYRGGITGISMQVLPLDTGKKSKKFHLYDTLNGNKGVKSHRGNGVIRYTGKGGDGTGKSGGKSGKGGASDTTLAKITADQVGVGTVLYADAKGKNRLGLVSDTSTPSSAYVKITFHGGKVITVKKTHVVYEVF